MKINKLCNILFVSMLSITFAYAQQAPMSGPMKPMAKKGNDPRDPSSKNEAKEEFSADANYDKNIKRVKEYTITDVDGDFGYINLGNQVVGQSGIVVNKKDYPIIVAMASVVESDASRSKLEFKPYLNLEQDAIPNTNLKASNNDIFVLNYLYEASMVIAPNIDSFQAVRKVFKDYSFLHPDLFAAFLKVEEEPVPSKDIIQKYALEQNLGSLVVVVENKAYLVDARTFKVIKSISIKYENEVNLKPFYTRVDEIETGSFDFGAESIGEYTKYYKELLEIK